MGHTTGAPAVLKVHDCHHMEKEPSNPGALRMAPQASAFAMAKAALGFVAIRERPEGDELVESIGHALPKDQNTLVENHPSEPS